MVEATIVTSEEGWEAMVYDVRIYVVYYLIMLVYVGCSHAPTIIDNTHTTAPVCEVTADCYTEDIYEPGTECITGHCLCPNKTHYPRPCCRKGAPVDACERYCRLPDECDPADMIPGIGPQSPSPVDPRCGVAKCVDGACSLEIQVGALASQIRGDCTTLFCDSTGAIVAQEDPTDAYNDGKQCTLDLCEGGKPVQAPYPNGFTCPEAGVGHCFLGECEMCISDILIAADCGPELDCDGTRCVPLICSNGMKDLESGETAADCGGSCVPCPQGYPCKVNADCMTGVCKSFACQVPACGDGVQNGSETGIDCGGAPSCKRCSAGYGCESGSDCESLVCWSGACQAPACNDGVKNGSETDIDCGGKCGVCL